VNYTNESKNDTEWKRGIKVLQGIALKIGILDVIMSKLLENKSTRQMIK